MAPAGRGVMDELEAIRAEARRKKAEKAEKNKYRRKYEPKYVAQDLALEMRKTMPPAPAPAPDASPKKRRKGSKLDPLEQPPEEGLPDPQSLRDLTAGLIPLKRGETLDEVTKSATGNKSWGPSVFERDSPRARATLRTFLCDFLVDDARGNVHIRTDIDLRSYREEALRPVTNATVQEICVMQPRMTTLDARGGVRFVPRRASLHKSTSSTGGTKHTTPRRPSSTGVLESHVSDCAELTDAALWAVSRHCPDLKTLKAAGIPGITRVGLRALTLACPLVTQLDLRRCAQLDDAALNAIAAGYPRLATLEVAGSPGVTDEGLAVLASGCRALKRLDVSDCPRVGEFGDRALLALGRYCAGLQRLDMFGCAHVQDAGIIAVARGCSELKQLRLTGCRELTGGALAALAKRCGDLEDLSIAGCERVRDADLCRLVGLAVKTPPREAIRRRSSAGGGDAGFATRGSYGRAQEVPGVASLTRLNVSNCGDVRARGLAAIAGRCPELRELTLAGCGKVGDDSCEALAQLGSRLRALDLSGCPLVSEAGVAAIARNITGLASLNVTNCKRVGRKFLVDLIEELKFCDLARDYVGYQPKANANALRLDAERRAREVRTAVMVQALWRGALWRIGLRAFRRRVYVERCITKLQAAQRAKTWRRRVAAVVLMDREHKAACWFQATWRAKKARAEVAKWRAEAARQRRCHRAAIKVQRVLRAHRAKRRVEAFRRAVEAARLDAARARARAELRARTVQRSWRGVAARKYARLVAARRDAARALALAKAMGALRIAAQWRAYLGRCRAADARDARRRRVFRWRTARFLQAFVRGCWGRMRAANIRSNALLEKKRKAATLIQSSWRAARARYLATMAASLEALRAQEKIAVVRIQAAARALFARREAEKRRVARALAVTRGAAAVVMQRVLRGHYGRTAWEVARRQQSLQGQAAPLYQRLDVLREESRLKSEARDTAKAAHKAFIKETKEIEAELREVSRVGHETWDTGRLSNGYPQRYVTSYLKARLAEACNQRRSKVAEYADEARLRTIEARDTERLIREVHREIAPLADGLAERTRRERIIRLRANVRRNEASATRLSSLARGLVCRAAMDRLLRHGPDQWEMHECDLSGEQYYFNAVSQQSRWTRPLELDYPVVLENRARCQRGRIGFVVRDAIEAGFYGQAAGLQMQIDDASRASIVTVETSADQGVSDGVLPGGYA